MINSIDGEVSGAMNKQNLTYIITIANVINDDSSLPFGSGIIDCKNINT